MNARKEIMDVLLASDKALNALNDAERMLESARRWGWADIAGGALIVTLVKQNRMKAAEVKINEARSAIQVLSSELQDLDGMERIHVDLDGFAAIADYLFDCVISDLFVQSRIKKTLDQVRRAKDLIGGIRDDLRAALLTNDSFEEE